MSGLGRRIGRLRGLEIRIKIKSRGLRRPGGFPAGIERLAKVLEGRFVQFGFEGGFDGGEDRFQDGFKAATDGTILAGFAEGEEKRLLLFDRAIDLTQGDFRRATGENGAGARAFMGFNESRGAERLENPADDDGMGVHAGAKRFGRAAPAFFARKHGQQMHRHGKSATGSHNRITSDM